MITIDQYKKAEKELKEIILEDDKLTKKQSQESHKVQEKYWKLEGELSKKKRKEMQKLTKKHEGEKVIINKKSVPHARIISQHTRIMNMMDIHKNRDKTDFAIYKTIGYYPESSKKNYSPLDIIKNDKYAKIQTFIVENNKPKNKFSLIIAGSTIFTEKIMKLPYIYGYPCGEERANIMYLLKDLPTEKELQEYYKRNKTKILKKDFFKELPEIEKEYESVLKNTDNKQWELAYWENKKDYYENHYCRGTETEEYQEVLKQIRKIKRELS